MIYYMSLILSKAMNVLVLHYFGLCLVFPIIYNEKMFVFK